MVRHKPAHLPEVDSLEIIRLGWEKVPGNDGVEDQVVAKDTIMLLPEPTARQFAKLWRNLPAGSRAKCWSPAFRLRFFSGQTLLVDGTVCWHCSTIEITDGDEKYKMGFDSSAPAAQKLLGLLLEEFGEPPAPSFGLMRF